MKTKLHSLFLGLALVAGVHQINAQVTNLGIAPAPGGQSVLYWPVSSTNYVLQTTANLATPNWVPASNAVPVNAATVTNAAPAGYFRLLATPDTTAGMVLIPAGSFTMGNYLFYSSPTNDADLLLADPTNVTVSAFYMDVKVVSWSQWQSVYSWATNHGYSFDQAGLGAAANHPVQMVSWYDAVKWCNARSEQAGLAPAYYTNAAQTLVYRTGQVEVQTNWVNWSSGYRLPTEAEWEKAARGGLSGQRFPWGNFINQNLANYYGDTNSYSYDLGPNGLNPIGSGGTSSGGTFAANGYGLYDMAGNVLQWCWDWHGTPYAGGSDPRGPASGSFRVLRGGGCTRTADYCRTAFRFFHYPTVVSSDFGFRSVLPTGP